MKSYLTFVYMKGEIQKTIILNVPSELKDEFKETCSLMGVTMTNILHVAILTYIEQSKQKPKK